VGLLHLCFTSQWGCIVLTVFRLKERCLQVVRRLVPRQAIPHLEIPVVLQDELMAFASDGDISMASEQRPFWTCNTQLDFIGYGGIAALGAAVAAAVPAAQPQDPLENGSRLLNPRIPSQLSNLLVQQSSNAAEAEPQPGPSQSHSNGEISAHPACPKEAENSHSDDSDDET
jgi:hypothetical protein